MKQTRDKVESYLQKARLLGLTIETFCSKFPPYRPNYYIVKQSFTSRMVLIPETTEYVGELALQTNFYGQIKLIGGSGLISTEYMFYDAGPFFIDLIDLTELDTKNVKDMKRMFNNCKVLNINFEGFNTSKAENMESMFSGCYAENLDLRSFDTSAVTNMQDMFNNCSSRTIDLSSFDTSKVDTMKSMFLYYEGKIISTDEKILQAYNNRRLMKAW